MNALKRLIRDAERNYYTLYKYDYIHTYFPCTYTECHQL